MIHSTTFTKDESLPRLVKELLFEMNILGLIGGICDGWLSTNE